MKIRQILCFMLALVLALSCLVGCDSDDQEKTVNCPSCGETVNDAEFCSACGAKLSQEPASSEDPDSAEDPKDPDTVECPSCKALCSKDTSFCESCGAELPKKTCAACGAENRVTAQFCNDCGAALSEEPDAPSEDADAPSEDADAPSEDAQIPDSGDRVGDGWEGVDFGGATLTVEVSGAIDPQSTFPACNIYTRGVDSGYVSDDIQRKVLTRNHSAQTDLNIQIEYMPNSNLSHDRVLDHIEKYVRGAAEDAPDVLDNDIYGLVRAMMNGYLWNVNNPGTDFDGNEIRSYFEFSPEKDAQEGKRGNGWYTDFMKGLSFDSNKLYLLAGNYNIDMLRYAWVLFTNIDEFDIAFADTAYGTYEEMVEYIIDTEDFVYDYLKDLARIGWRDVGNTKNETDLDDTIGLCLNNVCPDIFLFCSGLSLIKWSGGSEGKGTPSVYLPHSEGANNLAKLSQGYTELFSCWGVHYINDVLPSTTEFFNGNIILAVAKLGEMESGAMRGTNFKRGVLPFPRYDMNAPGFITAVDDRAEISCILNNASSFTLASAYLQYLNENSEDVLTEYYEKGLKFRYSQSKAVRDMIDFIKGNICSPFDSVLVSYLCAQKGKTLADLIESDAKQNKIGFASSYQNIQSEWQNALTDVLKKMERLY